MKLLLEINHKIKRMNYEKEIMSLFIKFKGISHVVESKINSKIKIAFSKLVINVLFTNPIIISCLLEWCNNHFLIKYDNTDKIPPILTI